MFTPALERILVIAAQGAQDRRHAHLTTEHVLLAIAHDPVGRRILHGSGVDVDQLIRSLTTYVEDQIDRVPEGSKRSPQQTVGFRRLLQSAVLHVQSAGKNEADVGDVLAALMQQPKSFAAETLAAQGITRLDVLNYISHGVSKRPENLPSGPAPAGDGEEGSSLPSDPLESFAPSLSERARQGLLDPLIGREKEVRRVLEILCRRRKNNPVLVGDPGVGKTAIVDGLAQALLRDDAPEFLKGAEIFALDTGSMLAGTRYRGDFEERFKQVVAALKKRPKPILFIDEIHTMVGAGATSGGTLDLSNMVKPILQEGDIRIIGATTFDEFKVIEKNAALFRRLQKIVVDEPSMADTVQILFGLKDRLEKHHEVSIKDDAIDGAAKLAQRHMREHRLPDSALDLLDEAGASLRLDKVDPRDVDLSLIERVVARVARIPEKQASLSDKERLRTLEEALNRVVFHQEKAVKLVSQAIKRSRAGLGPADRPVGCFLFTGPTGVGKTELAKQTAKQLGNEFIRFDMSEYMEKHTVSRLVGAPPGYVGFDQGGLLVDAVRKNPYCVVLLDEIEKAHPDIFNILLQVMDHATLTDNNGRKADFRQAILIMTSNAGSQEMSGRAIGLQRDASKDTAARGKGAIEKLFAPEFRNRLSAIVTFDSLPFEAMELIVSKFVLELEAQLRERKVAINLAEEARAWLARKGYDPKFGARPVTRVIQEHVRDPLTDEILFGELENGGEVTIKVNAAGDGLAFEFKPTIVKEPEAKIDA
ncbi:MAG: AAA family ATPase [Vicinamibacteria bacterium]|nr:AAA family ATPase [Vicinamibacteria bacterium]